jgi:hypothetical protein
MGWWIIRSYDLGGNEGRYKVRWEGWGRGERTWDEIE